MTSDSLYHYTDIAAIASIVKNKKLRLSNTGFLNDSQELIEGYRILSTQLDLFIADLVSKEVEVPRGAWIIKGAFNANAENKFDHNIYTCSFSRAANLLSQWRAYGSFAIEFSRSQLECKYNLYECIYNDDEKNGKAQSILEKHSDSLSIGLDEDPDDILDVHFEEFLDFMKTAGMFKNKYFQAESEVRMVEAGYHADEILYRARGDHLVPYMELTVPKESGSSHLRV
ncbi:DUF2971 domain-containing protein [Pseudomonas mandelii]|uniref:DUF2971 domain-containing protein n=2 Tax=Pseudomonas mandelii TaxID=75612 RepID=A0ABY0VVG2_9PSED|nr:DUF2971 domain-containing protein [Pseudomonas mandelii]TWS02805.1 DUF2971 domain-containing protein [Pseudomonas mandelii]SDU57991.1 hypothetical protein SAMN04489801_4667 [Pseudomonas mandelii]